MTFPQWQKEYAEHGIATFPVGIRDRAKKPLVRNYLRIGLPASSELARKFAEVTAFGFGLGERSKITVLDVDSKDERIFADAIARHGRTPFVVRSGSGNFQGWYRHAGERRHIRPDPRQPIDILGAGFVVAPPSQGVKSKYQIIEGSLNDLQQLPALQNFVPAVDIPIINAATIPIGQRNNALFRHCMGNARFCDDFEALLDVAETFAAQCEQAPDALLTAAEVRRVALSAWDYTQRGKNWCGADHTDCDRSTFPPSDLSSDPFLYTLLCWLRDHDGPGRSLMVAEALADVLGWSKHQLREAKRRAVKDGWLILVEPPTRTRAARFAWGPASTRYGLRNPEVMPERVRNKERGSVHSQVWIPEAIHGRATETSL